MKELLMAFASTDNTRSDFLHAPFNIGEHTFSTNGYTLICVEKQGEYNEVPIEKLKGVWPVEPNCNKSYSVEAIRQAVNACPLINETECDECYECDGAGEVEWDYDGKKGKQYHQEFECPCCDGTGEINTRLTGRRIFKKYDDAFHIVLNDSVFGAEYLNHIVLAADFFATTEVTLLAEGKAARNCFKIGNAEVIIMPVLHQDDETKAAMTVVPELTHA